MDACSFSVKCQDGFVDLRHVYCNWQYIFPASCVLACSLTKSKQQEKGTEGEEPEKEKEKEKERKQHVGSENNHLMPYMRLIFQMDSSESTSDIMIK